MTENSCMTFQKVFQKVWEFQDGGRNVTKAPNYIKNFGISEEGLSQEIDLSNLGNDCSF